MDTKVAKGRGEMECGAADARGPFGPCHRCGLLARRQDAGVGIAGQDGQVVGRQIGRLAADARYRPYRRNFVIF